MRELTRYRYSQIRCIALRVLQTSKEFWVFILADLLENTCLFVIGAFRSILFVSVFQGSLPVIVLFRASLLLRRFVFRMAEASAKRVTGDEPQGTMGRVQTAGEATSRPLSPSRLPLRPHFHQKRDVWVRGRLGTRSTI